MTCGRRKTQKLSQLPLCHGRLQNKMMEFEFRASGEFWELGIFFRVDVVMVRNWSTISPPHMIGGFLYFPAVSLCGCGCVGVCVQEQCFTKPLID